MNNQTRNNNLNYSIDRTFSKVNRLFVLSFENEEDRVSFSKYDTATVEITYYNIVIDGKSFFWCSTNKQRRNIWKYYWHG